MISNHYKYLSCAIDIHSIVDDFGTLLMVPSIRAWANAYRFANVVTFEQAGMHSYAQAVSEH